MDYQETPKSPMRLSPEQSTLPGVALVIGLIGIFFSFVPILGLILPSVAIILAHLSKGGNLHTYGKNRYAMVIGIIGTIICIVMSTLAIYMAGDLYKSYISNGIQNYELDTDNPDAIWDYFENELNNM